MPDHHLNHPIPRKEENHAGTSQRKNRCPIHKNRQTDRFQAALKKFLQAQKNKQPKQYQGKQTLKQLIKQNTGVSNIEIADENIKAFEPIARKHGLDYSLKKIKDENPPRYLVFFKGRDIDVMTEAFREFTATQLNRQKKPSIRKVLAAFKEKAKELNNSRDKVKNKDRGREL